ncbi:hypothetical protein SteCoe_7366 [Stentor coeruleus]|uniref:Ion transport domain-containing protein n=1 Tax=Stentor coeruleus TaxID=5963 RepID=A0A1R2CMU9_9CILI|nr:hypothetical protein SteCoe_7366 [Stentor coeruleus]
MQDPSVSNQPLLPRVQSLIQNAEDSEDKGLEAMKRITHTLQFLKGMSIEYTDRIIPITQPNNRTLNAISFSGDSKYFATGVKDNFICIHNIDENTSSTFLANPQSKISSLQFGPKGYFLLCAYEDGTFSYWDNIEKGVRGKVTRAHNLKINCIDISSDSNYIITGSEDTTAILWSKEYMDKIFSFENHTMPVTAVAFANKGNNVILGYNDGQLHVWGYKEKTLKLTLKYHKTTITSISIPKGQSSSLFASCSENILCVWDLTTRKSLFTYEYNKDKITSLCYNQNCSLLACSLESKKVDVISMNDFKTQTTFYDHSELITQVLFTTDDKYFASVDSGKINILKLSCNKNRKIASYGQNVIALCLNKDRSEIASSSNDGDFKIKKLSNLEVIVEEKSRSKYFCLAYGNMSNKIAKGTNDGGVIVTEYIQNNENKYIAEEPKRFGLETGSNDYVIALAFSRDDNFIAFSLSHSKEFFMVNLTNNEKKNYGQHNDDILCLSFSEDNKYIVSGSKDTSIMLWDLSPEAEFISTQLQGHKDWVFSVSISSKSRYIASGSADMTIIIRNLENHQIEFILLGHTGYIKSVCFSQDEKFLVSGSCDKQIKLWNLTERREEWSFIGHNDNVQCVLFGPDDKSIISSSLDNTVKEWYLEIPDELNISQNQVAVKNFLLSPCANFGLFIMSDNKYLLKGANIPELDEYSNDNWTAGFNEKSDLVLRQGENIKNFPLGSIKNPTESIECLESFYDFKDIFQSGYQNFIQFHDLMQALQEDNLADVSLKSLEIAVSKNNFTGLHFVAYKGVNSIIESMIEDKSILIKVDAFGHSPLYYAIKRQQQQSVDLLLKYLFKLSLEPNQNLFYKSIFSVRNDILLILENSSPYLQKFLDVCLYSDKNSIEFGNPKGKLPMIISSNMILPVIDDFTESKTSLKKPLYLSFSLFPFKSTSYTLSSINLLKTIINCKNEDIFRSHFIQYIIMEKWQKMNWFIYCLTILLWLNLIFIVFSIGDFYKLGNISIISLIILNVILLIFEIFQFAQDYKSYFKDKWNILDTIRVVCTLPCAALILVKVDLPPIIMWPVILLNFLRGLTGFRAFDKTRFYVRLILESLNNIKFFLIIFMYGVLGFGVLDVTEKNSEITFNSLIINPFVFSVGQFETSKEFTIAEVLTFSSAVIIIIILMMNMIVSILGDSFDEFQYKSVIYDYKEMAQAVLELEYFIRPFKSFSENEEFMHVCTDAYESQNMNWKGKVLDVRDWVALINEKMNKKIRVLNQSVFNTNEKFISSKINVNKKIRSIDANLKRLFNELPNNNRLD